MCIPLEEEGATMHSWVDHRVILWQLVFSLNLNNKSTGSSVMSQEDFQMFSLLDVLGLSSAASAYLWFVRKHRSGVLIWSLYGVRALCGLLAIGVALMAWNILIEGTDAGSVFAFAGPIGLFGLMSVMPWGLLSVNFR